MGSVSQIIGEVKKVIVGKDRTLLWVLTTILARGHILLEDIPGVGKTTMALAFSKARAAVGHHGLFYLSEGDRGHGLPARRGADQRVSGR